MPPVMPSLLGLPATCGWSEPHAAVASTSPAVAMRSRRRITSFLTLLDHDGGGLDHRDGQRPDLQVQRVDGLAAHQGHDPERPGLDVDLCHDGVLHHRRDDATQPVARRRAMVVRDRVGAERPGETRQLDAADHAVAVTVPLRTEPAGVDPAPYRVRAHPEQVGGLTDAESGHPATLDPGVCEENTPSHPASSCESSSEASHLRTTSSRGRGSRCGRTDSPRLRAPYTAQAAAPAAVRAPPTISVHRGPKVCPIQPITGEPSMVLPISTSCTAPSPGRAWSA